MTDNLPRYYYTFSIERLDTMKDLQECLHEIPRRLLNSKSMNDNFTLDVDCDFTPPMLALLSQVLNQPLPTKEGKWDHVNFRHCGFLRPCPTQLVADEKEYVSQNEIQSFASDVARRTLMLRLHKSPEILACMFDCVHLELKTLHLSAVPLNAFECRGLAALVQKCITLTDLRFFTSFLEEPLFLGEALANSFHLQRVRFEVCNPPSPGALSDILVGKDGNCIVGQLLSPKSRLQSLTLHAAQIVDLHFLQIVDMLPISNLQVLDVGFNCIGCQGILAFASQLPKITCLKEVRLSCNLWDKDVWHSFPVPHKKPLKANYEPYATLPAPCGACLTALLQGMIKNYSMERLYMNYTDQLLEYCNRRNRARRQILVAANSLPLGLWPWILELVGTCPWDPTGDSGLGFETYTPNAVYFVLQNSPILFVRSTPSLRRSQRKITRVSRYC